MTVYIYDKDAFKKICKVEGEEYSKQQSRWKDNTFRLAKNNYDKLSENAKNSTTKMGMWIIYGFMGIDRYVVYNSGEIKFIALQSSKEFINKARKEGFDID